MLKFLKLILGCDYISDLRFAPYNSKAKAILGVIGKLCPNKVKIKAISEYLA